MRLVAVTMSNSNIKHAVEQWLKDSYVPVTSAAYQLSDKAALALSSGYLDPHLRTVLYTRLQKGSTTPRVGDVEELESSLPPLPSGTVQHKKIPHLLCKSRFISDESNREPNDLRRSGTPSVPQIHGHSRRKTLLCQLLSFFEILARYS